MWDNQKKKKIPYIKFTNLLSFQTRFPKSGPTYRGKVVNPRHQTPQGQSVVKTGTRNNILSTHIPFIPCWSALPCLRCSYLKNWPLKSMVKVMGEVTVQSHNVGLTSYRLTSLSFHVNQASNSWVTTFSKLTLKIKGQSHGWGHSSKSQYGSNILSTNIP